ncbi:nitrate reductase [Bacillus atrophaeus]|uniref:nitrate reductase n=1 Tax=Bacillus atrophaeus TaxID=1452 RepID=UPI001CB96C2B|nr:nitrate reductase [Bacillus atrophaeus]MCY9135995.1 nitrate reductase [Bacillus atrophaeus]
MVVEKLEGRTVSSFIGQPPSVLQSLGEGVARIHVNQKRYAGNPSGTFRVEQHVITGMKQIVSSFYADHHQIAAILPDIIGGLKELPALDSSSFVLIDIDPSQFLSDGRTITGLVDTEAYVIAPRAFDFIGLEYILDEASAAEFSIGYEKVMPLPDLTFVRLPYRYLYRLLSVQGSVDLDEWLEYKTLF